jgi:glutamate--cysteine ligase catalytic subunit
MYDQLAVLAPIMMAMTAATPIFKGRLADIDARWTVISQSVDDRTAAERGLVADNALPSHVDERMAGNGVRLIPKSRYDSISTYIYHCKGEPACQRTFAAYNDANCPADEETKELLRREGVDENLAHHVAHLFIRDPIVAFNGQIELNDEESTNHFESIQSTNWQSCRWKPPPFAHADGPHIGWRTEFRTMEAQLTDFENAAFTVFVVLITRVVLAFDLGFYIPLSKVDENMQRAHLRDAVTNQKFFFRRHIAPPEVNFSEGETSSDEETSGHGKADSSSSTSGCHACSSKRVSFILLKIFC